MNLERWLRPRVRWPIGALGLCVGLASGSLACLGPNPFLDEGVGTAESTDGDGDPTGDGDGEPETGGDGDPTGDGDGEPASCDNDVEDGDETDVDCGGSCGPCGPGGSCLFPSDCTSMVCDTNICTEPACDDDVLNGDELEIDCGGSCRFCAHSDYENELDDFEASSAVVPAVALFDDGVFAVLYGSFTGMPEFRVRWFDEFATELGPGIVISDLMTETTLESASLAATTDLRDHAIYAVLAGQDMNSSTDDVFAIGRSQQAATSMLPIYQGPSAVTRADMILDGDMATRVYLEGGAVKLRRYNYATNSSVGVVETANPDFATRPARSATLARRNGVTVVAWVACNQMMLADCELEARAFDLGWVQNQPVSLGLPIDDYRGPKLAIASDDRVGLTFNSGPNNASRQSEAMWLDAGLGVEGRWDLGEPGSAVFTGLSDVVALEDGTFAFAWAESMNDRVSIRRFTAPDTPLVTNVDDEAPWPTTSEPGWVRASAAGNKVAVTWSAAVDTVYQVQGQVLSY